MRAESSGTWRLGVFDASNTRALKISRDCAEQAQKAFRVLRAFEVNLPQHHGNGHVGVRRFTSGITSAPKRSMVSSVKRGSTPGQSTMNHITSAPNSS